MKTTNKKVFILVRLYLVPLPCQNLRQPSQLALAVSTSDTMKSFCSKYNVEEKHVIAYVNHLKDIEIRKDMKTRAAEE